MSSQSQESKAPRTSIRTAYENCLAARRQWLSVRGRTTDEEVRDQAHGDLHETVLGWFEALIPYISERPGEVKELWENAPLYPLEPKTRPGAQCQNEGCGSVYDPESGPIQVGDICPDCGDTMGECGLPVTDENDRVLWEWKCGLKTLASWTNQTVTETVSDGKWSTDAKTIERPQRLSPTILMRAARYLDTAAEECGILEDTDRVLPTGEL